MAHCAVFLFAVLLASVELGSCLQCYQCNSQRDPKCAENNLNDPKFLVDCNNLSNFNRLYVQPVFPSLGDAVQGAPKSCHKIVLGSSNTVIRTCLDANPTDLNRSCKLLSDTAAAFTNDPSRRLVTCDVCNKDACNSAGTFVASLPLALLTAVISYLYYKY